jgi:hypothetical protein
MMHKFIKRFLGINDIEKEMAQYKADIHKINYHRIKISELEWNRLVNKMNEIITSDRKKLLDCLTSISHLNLSRDLLINYNQEVKTLIPGLLSYELASIARAYSRNNIKNPDFFEQVCKRADEIAEKMNASDIERLIFSLKKVEFHKESLFTKLEVRACEQLNKTSPSNFTDLVQIFSMIKSKRYLEKGKFYPEKNGKKFKDTQKIHILANYLNFDISLPNTLNYLFDNINSLSNDDFVLLGSYLTKIPTLANKFRENFILSANQRDWTLLNPKSSMLLINACHELGAGKEIAKRIAKVTESLCFRYETNQYPLIIYVYGINQQGTEAFWEKFKKRTAKEIYTLSVLQLSLASYGLLRAGKLDEELFRTIEKICIDKNYTENQINSRILGRFIQVAEKFPTSSFLVHLKSQFKTIHQSFKPNKALIAIEVFTSHNLMDEDLYRILKIHKDK